MSINFLIPGLSIGGTMAGAVIAQAAPAGTLNNESPISIGLMVGVIGGIIVLTRVLTNLGRDMREVQTTMKRLACHPLDESGSCDLDRKDHHKE